MFSLPEYSSAVSLCLSEILDDLGVNEKIVLKRGRAFLLNESVHTIAIHLDGIEFSSYIFGSQIEGTTVLGLHSDLDKVHCINEFNIIQNFEDWEHGLSNYLMIQDDNVSPGYCMLQCLRNDAPLPLTCNYLPPQKHHFRDSIGRILLQNTFSEEANLIKTVKNGPAHSLVGRPGVADTDNVLTIPCKTWPVNARPWLDRQGVGLWPTKEMRKYCSTSGCFAVPVGRKGSVYEELEWRISTSHAERCLMFNLNITQLRCYVLMKMIINKYIKPYFEDTISSFMCKTLLFYCVENAHCSIWREDNLLGCLTFCLFMLLKSVETEYCPHFIINNNNLIAGKISREIKPYILEILKYIVISNGRALLGIDCDDLSTRLELKINNLYRWLQNIQGPNELISGNMIFNVGCSIHSAFKIYFFQTDIL